MGDGRANANKARQSWSSPVAGNAVPVRLLCFGSQISLSTEMIDLDFVLKPGSECSLRE